MGWSDSRTDAGIPSAQALPNSSVGIWCTEPTPSPASRRALSAEEWISADATISIGGAPASPSAATSQPTRRSSVSRAVMIAVRLAIDAPAQNEVAASVGRPQHVEDPLRRDCIEVRGDRRHHRQRRVLIPRTCQNRCGQTDRLHTAGHEAEVAAPGVRHRRRAADLVEHLDHADRVEWTIEGRIGRDRSQSVDLFGRGEHRPIALGRHVRRRAPGAVQEQIGLRRRSGGRRHATSLVDPDETRSMA